MTGRNAFLGDRADDRARSSGRAVVPLRPETSDNYDAGFRFTRGPVHASLTAFTLTLSEAIVSQTLILPQGAVGRPLGDQIIASSFPAAPCSSLSPPPPF